MIIAHFYIVAAQTDTRLVQRAWEFVPMPAIPSVGQKISLCPYEKEDVEGEVVSVGRWSVGYDPTTAGAEMADVHVDIEVQVSEEDLNQLPDGWPS